MRTEGGGPGVGPALRSARWLHGTPAVANLEAVGLDFIERAPKRLVFEAEVHAPIERVFAAISSDPKSWSEWFPGFRDGAYEGPAGLGAKRWVRIGGMTYRETIIAWDEPVRYAWRVDSSSAPMAKALVEEWTLEPRGDATLARWTFAIDPRVLFRIGMPVAKPVMGWLFRTAMRKMGQTLSGGLRT